MVMRDGLLGPPWSTTNVLSVSFHKHEVKKMSTRYFFFFHDITFPKVNLDDFLRQVATNIITLLTSPSSSTTASLEKGDPTRNALLKIIETVKTAEKIPNPVA